MSNLFFGTDLPGEFDRVQRQIVRILPGFPASLCAMRSESFFSGRQHRQYRRKR